MGSESSAASRSPSSSYGSSQAAFGVYLRAAAIGTGVSALLAGLVVPGLRGNAPEGVVVVLERLSQSLTGALWIGLLLLVVRGVYDLARAHRVSGWSRGPAIAGAGVVVAVMFFAFRMRLASTFSIVMALSALCVAFSCAAAAVRAPHTRAVAIILGILAVSASLRIVAWEVATLAGERASPSLYAMSRSVATAGVLAEGAGQLIAAMWIGTRARITGQFLASIAISSAFLLTWGAAQGAHSGAPLWQSVVHSALTDAPGTPPPYGLSAFATFLVPCAVLLALVAAVQPRQVTAVVVALSFALVARGGYDVPLRALAASAAGLWLAVASVDDRTMWKALAAGRPAGEVRL